MKTKYLSMLSTIMLIGSSLVSAMDDAIQDSKISIAEQEYGSQPKSELGNLKGPTRLPKSKQCQEKYKDCSQLYGADKEKCEQMKQLCENKKFTGEAYFGDDEEKVRIHGKQNPYRKVKNMVDHPSYNPFEDDSEMQKFENNIDDFDLNVSEDSFFDNIPEVEERKIGDSSTDDSYNSVENVSKRQEFKNISNLDLSASDNSFESKNTGSVTQSDPFDISEVEEYPIEKESGYSTGRNGIYDTHNI